MPLKELLTWPHWQLSLYESFLSVELAPEARIEMAIARLSALAHNRTRGANAAPADPADFMPPNPWERDTPPEGELTSEELQMMRGLHGTRKP